ncbi:MAG: hypothetical protein KGZ86_00760 [Candidatus Latescibacteria bacterium]|nr:hypothetical protein [Candidatus Latescibacterota bacterium]
MSWATIFDKIIEKVKLNFLNRIKSPSKKTIIKVSKSNVGIIQQADVIKNITKVGALPRHLSVYQKTILLSKLRTIKSKARFVSRLMDVESSNFADELNAVFREANWEMLPRNNTFLDDFPSDLTIYITGDNLVHISDFVSQTFNELNIKCAPYNIRENSISHSEPDAIHIIVLSNKLL